MVFAPRRGSNNPGSLDIEVSNARGVWPFLHVTPASKRRFSNLGRRSISEFWALGRRRQGAFG
eukprot:5219758-Lingulodinium_polyedra.AAC.1